MSVRKARRSESRDSGLSALVLQKNEAEREVGERLGGEGPQSRTEQVFKICNRV